MIYLAFAALVGWGLTISLFARLVRSLVHEQKNEREALQNKLMHLSGHTWEPPPAEGDWAIPEPEEDFEDVDQVLP